MGTGIEVSMGTNVAGFEPHTSLNHLIHFYH
jgi:hypothetical protein